MQQMSHPLNDRPPAVKQHQLPQVFACRRLCGQQPLQTGIKRFGFQIDGQNFLQHIEARIHAGFDGVLTQQCRAKSVDGADRRRFQIAEMTSPNIRIVSVGRAKLPSTCSRMRPRISRAAPSVKVMATI